LYIDLTQKSSPCTGELLNNQLMGRLQVVQRIGGINHPLPYKGWVKRGERMRRLVEYIRQYS